MGVKDTLQDLLGIAQKTAATAVDTGKAAVELHRLEKALAKLQIELALLIEKKYREAKVEMPQDAAHICADIDALRTEIAVLKGELNVTRENAVSSIRNASQKSVETIKNVSTKGAETIKDVSAKGMDKARKFWDSKVEPLTCPECGYVLHKDFAFCPLCGTELDDVDDMLDDLTTLEPDEVKEKESEAADTMDI